MRFGVCAEPEAAALLAEAGYDYCELPASAVRPFEDDAAVRETVRALDALPLRAEAFNLLVPASLPLVGPGADREALATYFRRAFERMAQVGGAVAVLGSGAARRLPEAAPESPKRAAALAQLTASIALAAEAARDAGVTLALEHLNRDECNVFTTLAECQRFVEREGMPGLRLLADAYHLAVEDEPLADVARAGGLLAHAHIAGAGRRTPGPDGADYAGFFGALRDAGYDARLSVECRWDDLATQAAPTRAFLQEQWNTSAPAR